MEDAGHELLIDAVDRFPLRKSQEDPDPVPLAVLQTGEVNPAVPAESNTGSVRVAGPERRRHEASLTLSAQSTDRVNPEASGWTKSCLDMAEAEPEWMKCFEPGVYLKLKQLSDGTQDLKKVRFSSKCFTDSQAQDWWKENRDKVYERYNVRTSLSATSSDACKCGVSFAFSPSCLDVCPSAGRCTNMSE